MKNFLSGVIFSFVLAACSKDCFYVYRMQKDQNLLLSRHNEELSLRNAKWNEDSVFTLLAENHTSKPVRIYLHSSSLLLNGRLVYGGDKLKSKLFLGPRSVQELKFPIELAKAVSPSEDFAELGLKSRMVYEIDGNDSLKSISSQWLMVPDGTYSYGQMVGLKYSVKPQISGNIYERYFKKAAPDRIIIAVRKK
ncbi:MAG: hypothetical protein MI784_17750 [Cytophagales bacterium]|nr:hypothetical protein [Cytophagales bacterium]